MWWHIFRISCLVCCFLHAWICVDTEPRCNPEMLWSLRNAEQRFYPWFRETVTSSVSRSSAVLHVCTAVKLILCVSSQTPSFILNLKKYIIYIYMIQKLPEQVSNLSRWSICLDNVSNLLDNLSIVFPVLKIMNAKSAHELSVYLTTVSTHSQNTCRFGDWIF